MSVQTMFSHTKEIVALTIPILSVMIIVSLATAGVINLKDESTLTPKTDNTVPITDTQETSVPLPSEVASQVEKSNTSSASESINPTATATPTTNPQTEESTASAVSETATPTTQPTPTITLIPSVTISPTISEGSFQFRVIQTVDNEDVPVEGAKVVAKKTEPDETIYEGITNTEGLTLQWKVPDFAEIDVYAYPPAVLDTYCGTVLHAKIESLILNKPIDLTLVHSDNTEFCIQEGRKTIDNP
ncbi:MAG: hypothetical protein UU81_C0019G0019 [Microgenomates group bacterium GW2011_GWC1_41_8]|nr:MAG: hypothetical protein UU81_C0019G0019 [Microgenomates group bacterium GW2011_GWC1_41_8]